MTMDEGNRETEVGDWRQKKLKAQGLVLILVLFAAGEKIQLIL